MNRLINDVLSKSVVITLSFAMLGVLVASNLRNSIQRVLKRTKN